jgi:transglutaminase-like putative cysteine protease
MRAADRYAIAITLAMILASFTLQPLTQDESYLRHSWLLIITINAVSVLLRRTRGGSVAAGIAQLALLASYAVLLSRALVPAPDVGTIERMVLLLNDAAEHMRTQAAPMSPNDGVLWLFVVAVGVITLLCDLLVVSLRKPALGLAPPLTMFLVPAIGLGVDTGVRAFACVAIGYLAILLAEGLNSYAGWTHGLSRDSARGSAAQSAGLVVWRAATYVGVPAVVLAVIASSAMPTAAFTGWGFSESGGGSGPLRLSDPTLDLKRNLTLPEDQAVMTYRTNKDSGSYLRMASLPAFSSAGWQNAQTSLDPGRRLPQPPGLTEPTGADRVTEIQITGLGSEYLPMPFAPRSFEAPGQWGHDPRSLVVISSERGADRRTATEGLNYSVVSRDIDPDPETLTGVLSGSPPDADLTEEVPEDLPNNIRRLAQRITEDAATPAEKAAAIQGYLRDRDNFTYSTDPRPGSGYRALENFLFQDQQGYCEQFAASMAVLARVVGIPSRVAVGFLPGDRNGDVWTVSARDAHAWPELYFSGYGWVRYEPTPASVTGTPPDWSLERSDEPDDDPTDDPEPNQPTAQPNQTAAAPQPSAPTQQQAPTVDTGVPVGRVVGVIGGVLAGLAVLAAPALIRIRRRQLRLGGTFEDPGEQVEAGWAEVRDTAADLRRPWPAGSPRTIAVAVGRHTDADTQQALTQLSKLVELERYSRHFADGEAAAQVATLVTTIRTGMLSDRRARSRLATALLPRSVFRSLIIRRR